MRKGLWFQKSIPKERLSRMKLHSPFLEDHPCLVSDRLSHPRHETPGVYRPVTLGIALQHVRIGFAHES